MQTGGVGHAAKLRVVDDKGHTRTVAVTYEARPDRETHAAPLAHRPARRPTSQPAVQTGAKLGKLSSLRGKVVVIDFFATWCGPCVESMPHVEEMHKKLAAQGLVVFGVSNESRDDRGRRGREAFTSPIRSPPTRARACRRAIRCSRCRRWW